MKSKQRVLLQDMPPKDTDRSANIEDLIQTMPLSVILFYENCTTIICPNFEAGRVENVDLDKTAPVGVSDQCLHCLPFGSISWWHFSLQNSYKVDPGSAIIKICSQS